MKRSYLVIMTLLLLLPGHHVSAVERTDSLLLKVYFRQGVSRLEPDYRGNAQMLERFTGEVNRMSNDPSYNIQDIIIRSGASPEGAFDHNRDLSWNRGRELKDYLQTALLIPDNKFCIEAVGEDWQALREKVERNSVPDKEKILSILDKYSDWIDGSPTSTVGGPKKELMDLNGGRTWFWLLDNIYPDLRSAGNTVVCRYTRLDDRIVSAAPAHRVDTVFHSRVDTLYIINTSGVVPAGAVLAAGVNAANAATANPAVDEAAEKAARREKRFKDAKPVFAFRSNLLVPLMNIGVEVPIGNRWSVGADYYYPWIFRDLSRNERCFQFLGADLEVRYWLGQRHLPGSDNWKYRLTGHSIGAFAAAGYYDFGINWTGCQGEFIIGGLDYLYAMPLGKGGVHMEFELGIGYMYSPTTRYVVYVEGGKLFRRDESRDIKSYFGPIKAGVSIVIPIFAKTKARKVESDEK